MGIMSGLASVANKLVGKKYRTGTWYDFSVLVRARFIVYEYTVSDQTKEIVEDKTTFFDKVDVLPLQINPESFRSQRICHSSKLINFDSPLGARNFGRDENEINIQAHFNIEDEYMAVTQNATIPLDYDINELTIISKLYQYAADNYRVLFKWGPISYLARIASVICDYKSFSPYGEPLSAEVDMTLRRHVPPGGGNRTGKDIVANQSVEKMEEDLVNKLSWSDSGKIDSATVAAQLIVDKTASEALPSIIRSLR